MSFKKNIGEPFVQVKEIPTNHLNKIEHVFDIVDESKTFWNGDQTNKNFDSYFHNDNTMSPNTLSKRNKSSENDI